MNKNYKTIFIRIFSIITIFLISNCGKEKSKKWLVIDLQIVNEVTFAPVKSRIEIEWVNTSIFGSWKEKKDIGFTDEKGRLYLEMPSSRRVDHYTLLIYPIGWYGSPGYSHPTAKVGVSTGKKNIKTVTLAPLYPYKISVKNTNCTGTLDSMWMNISNYDKLFTGCADTILINTLGITTYQQTPELNIQIKSKKSGQILTSNYQFMLEPAKVKNIELIY